MSQENKILDANNKPLKVANFLTPSQNRTTLSGVPLGTADGTATGVLAAKVMLVGASAVISPTNLATSAKQDTQITAEQAILSALTRTVTPHTVAIAASSSGNIPSGAKGWAIVFLTGSGSLGGAAIVVGSSPISIGDDNILATNLAYTTDSASTAFLYYNT